MFNTTTKKLDFPAGVPKSRFPQKGLKGRKVLMVGVNSGPTAFIGPVPSEIGGSIVLTNQRSENSSFSVPSFEKEENPIGGSIVLTNQRSGNSSFSVPSFEKEEDPTASTNQGVASDASSGSCDGDEHEFLGSAGPSMVSSDSRGCPSPTSRCLLTGVVSSAMLYVDSGAGQSLSSCSKAFAQMVPCQVEITGIAGALQIYGCGNALFLFDDGSAHLVLLCIHNFLYGHRDFNLLSVSQICQMEGNSVDFALGSPVLVLKSRNRHLRIPLFMEDGLFAISVTPFQMDDPRYPTLPKFDVTPSEEFRLSDDLSAHQWSSRVLVSASMKARILVAPSSGDFDCNLKSFCGNFLAPPSIPVARRQYDPTVETDMAELTIRFLGLGDDRLRRTIALNNGLSSPASKDTSRVSRMKPLFSHGRWAEGKTPRVSKGKIGNLCHAKVGEVVFSDTFESSDPRY